MRKVLTVLVVAALAAAGCGDDDDSSSGGGGAGAQSTTATTPAAANVAFQSDVLSGLPIGYPEPKPEKLEVAMLSPLSAAESVSIIVKNFEDAVRKLGGTPIVYDAQMRPDRQVSQIEQAVARKVDGIVIFPVDARALNPGVAAAKKAGIPTVAIEYNNASRTEIGQLDSQILEGIDYVAYEQVKGAASKLPKGAKVVHIGLNVPSPVFSRLAAQTKHWAEKFGLDYLGDVKAQQDDVAGGEEAATRVFSEYPDVQGILAYADQTALGAAATARAQGKRDVLITGNFGGGPSGLDAVEEGRIGGTVLFNLQEIGKFAAWGIYNAVENPDQPLPKSVTISAPRFVDQASAAQIPRS
jgi:ABC-type sugar transport system substrate-binding protein